MNILNPDGKTFPEPGELVEVGRGRAYAKLGAGSLDTGSRRGKRGGQARPLQGDTHMCGYTGVWTHRYMPVCVHTHPGK